MKTIKQSIFIICFTLISVLLYSNNYIPPTDSINCNINIYNTILPTETIQENFYRSRIPEEFIDAFLYYTKDRKEMRLIFYSIMVYESANFRVYEHLNPNKSIDYGPSHLNSCNIKNKYFIELYGPDDTTHITSTYCYYMVLTINLYWDLHTKYGPRYALYGYNGGERAIKLIQDKSYTNSQMEYIRHVTAYNRNVNAHLLEYEKTLRNYTIVEKFKLLQELDYSISILLMRNISSTIEKLNHIVNNYGIYFITSGKFHDFIFEEYEIVVHSEVTQFNIHRRQKHVSFAF